MNSEKKVRNISGSSWMQAIRWGIWIEMIESNLKGVRVPGDSWPGLNDVLACLENISALDDEFECRLHVFMPRKLPNDAMKLK